MDRLDANFGSYELISAIGQGTLGTVYRARQIRLNREVAVKFLDSELAATFSRDDFAREASALASIYHPNVAMVLDAGSARDQFFLVTELVDGLVLRDFISAGCCDDDELLGIFSQICDGLEYAHDEGILHLDLTPNHVIVNRLGWVKLVDFRMSRAYQEGLVGSREGAPYTSPELLGGDPVSPASDVYSAGKLLWYLLTGDVPPVHHDGDLDDRCADIPERWRGAVCRSVKTDPQLRFQSIDEFRMSTLEAFELSHLEFAGQVEGEEE